MVDLHPAPAAATTGLEPSGSTAPVAEARSARLRDLETRLTPAARQRRVPGTVAVFTFACLIGALASVYTVRAGTNLDYVDAMAHLTIARRILDGTNPGLAQLGTVWLPLPHLLLMPLVQDMWLFRTGVAGCIVGAVCLGASASALWRISARLGLGLSGRVVSLLVLLANPSLLYVFTTALTEPVLIATLLCTLAGLAGWVQSPRQLSGGELAVFAGLPAAAGVLTRYEAWPMLLSSIVVVVVASRRKQHTWRRAGGYALAFAAPGLVAALGWLAYNLATYGNPLEFLSGDYSAAAFTEAFIEKGELTTKGNLGLSFAVLGWALVETAGVVALVAAGVGLLLMTWHWGLDNRSLMVWTAGSSTAFLLVSLTTGQHIMVNDMSLPPGAYNNRYVLSTLPWLALLAAVGVDLLVRRWSRASLPLVLVCAVAVTAQNLWWVERPGERMTVIREAQEQHRDFREVKAAGRWLGAHYDGGMVLMDQTSSRSSIAPVIGLRMDEFYTRASGDAFDEAIADPYRRARWVFMHREQVTDATTEAGIDLVTEELMGDRRFHARYRLVYAIADLGIYRRIAPAG